MDKRKCNYGCYRVIVGILNDMYTLFWEYTDPTDVCYCTLISLANLLYAYWKIFKHLFLF